MRIVLERIDKENYLELCISQKEFKHLEEYLLLSCPFTVDGERTYIGIKLEIEEGEVDENIDFQSV